MKFFSNALNALKPNDYSVQISSGVTTAAAVRTVRRAQFSYPVRKIVGTLLALVIIGGGAAAGFSTNVVTSPKAQASWISDQFCTNANSGNNSGISWGNKNEYSDFGGNTVLTMPLVTSGMNRDTALSSSPLLGNVNTSTDKSLTAYEKYGVGYPIFDSWAPAWTDDNTFDFQGPTPGYSASFSGGPSSSFKIPKGVGALTTQNTISCFNIPGSIESNVANITSYPMKLLMGLSIQLYGTSYGQGISEKGSLLYPIGQAINTIIAGPGGLRDTLFIPFLLPLVMIGAIILAYDILIKRKGLKGLQSIVWMILAIALGTFFLQQPTKIAGFSDSIVANVQTALNSAITDSASTNDMCNVGSKPTTGDATRSVECSIWYASLYQPWVVGQFGVGTNDLNSSHSSRGYQILTADPQGILNNKDYSIHYGSTVVEADNWPQFMLDRQTNGLALQQSYVAYAQLSGDPASIGPVTTTSDGTKVGTINGIWKGGTGSQMISALLLWISVPASSIVLLVFGMSLLIYQLIMVSAVFMSPFFFLLGIIPNYGRAILGRYAELLVTLIIKRIITSLVLVMYFIFYLILISDMTVTAILLRQLLIAVLAIMAISMRGKFANMFASKVNFGGDKSIGLPGGKVFGQVMGLVGAGAGFAVGGVTGAAIGHKVASRVTSDHNDDLSGQPTADTASRSKSSMGDDIMGIARKKDDVESLKGDVDKFRQKRATAQAERKRSKDSPSQPKESTGEKSTPTSNRVEPAWQQKDKSPDSPTRATPSPKTPNANGSGVAPRPIIPTPTVGGMGGTAGASEATSAASTATGATGASAATTGAAGAGAASAAAIAPPVLGVVAAKKVGDIAGDKIADKVTGTDKNGGAGGRPTFPKRGE